MHRNNSDRQLEDAKHQITLQGTDEADKVEEILPQMNKKSLGGTPGTPGVAVPRGLHALRSTSGVPPLRYSRAHFFSARKTEKMVQSRKSPAGVSEYLHRAVYIFGSLGVIHELVCLEEITMVECCTGPAGIFRKVALMTLIGFGVLVLSGPAIAVIATLLPFALVGGLVWLLVQAVLLGPRVAGAMIRNTFKLVFGGPIWLLKRAWGGVRWVGGTAFALAGTALSMALPIAGGAFLGGVLGAIGGMEHNDADFRVPAGIAIGAGIGLVAGALRSRPKQKVLTVLPATPNPVA
jgi:hypothetical protein